jgi:hypothetical protein
MMRCAKMDRDRLLKVAAARHGQVAMIAGQVGSSGDRFVQLVRDNVERGTDPEDGG